jgi:phospholipid transport system substrate-binding protein
MLTRRALPGLTAAAAMLAVPLFKRSASAAEASQAADFVKHVGDQLIAVVNGEGSEQQKRARLQQVINNAVDVDGVARFCLGRFWRLASPEQQKQYVALFHEVLLNNISGHLGEYRGVHFTLGKTQTREDGEVVSSVVERPNNPPTNVDWVISNESGGPKIVDVVAEGTSLRLTQRSDYAAYLAHNNNNVQALIEAMRQQLAQKTG